MVAENMISSRMLATLVPELALPGRAGTIAVNGLCLDSRNLVPGDLFVAVVGSASDGRNYIEGAVARGAVAVLAEAEGLAVADSAIPVIAVDRLAEKVSRIAGRFYQNPSEQMTVIGITGTNGKTTCSQLLGQLYSLCEVKTGVIGTLGYGIFDGAEELMLSDTGMTTPDAISTQKILAEMHELGVSRVAMEVSSHSLDQHRVAAVRFSAAVFTNLSRDHLDYHGDLHSYSAAKQALFRMPGLRTAVVNRDDAVGRDIAAMLGRGGNSGVHCLTYGVWSRPGNAPRDYADIVASQVELLPGGINACLQTPWGEGQLQSRLLGEFNLSNLLAVIGTACADGLALDRVLARLPALQPVAGRMEVVASTAGPQVVVDYAHTPDALEQALDALRHHCPGRLWVVFGCGGDRDRGKRPEMAAIAERCADRVVVTSDNPRSERPDAIIAEICTGFTRPAQVETVVDRAEAIARAVTGADPRDTVLVAGKGHENYQQVGAARLPFSDVAQARLSLRIRSAASSPSGEGAGR